MSLISENAKTILEKRYLSNGESIDGMFRRVSLGNDQYYKLLSDLLFLPNSPTLFNAGLNNGCTLSACFVFDVDDSLREGSRSIMATRDKAAAVAKAGGGVGYYFGNIRPKGSLIKSVHRKACGPVAVLRDYHGLRSLITQGGKRDLAQMGVLPCWHEDIREFIHAKDDDPKSLESFNISVSWTDDAVQKALSGDEYYSTLWKEQVSSAWKTGDPGCLFYDAINRGNPNVDTVGLINATNPCGETPNRSDEPCNLGSISLRRFVTKNREVDWKKLEEVVYLSTWFLDDILDANVFPHPEITKAALATRKLGLGVMGWADMLAQLHIHYDSQEAVDLADKLMAFIAEVSLAASEEMADQKGKPYEAFDEVRTIGPCVRNETRTSIAPTGTISIIADCSSSIEPHFSLEWERTTNEGIKMQERIAVWDDLDGFIPKTASEIDWQWHIRHQAAFQKHTDLGVSKTINMTNSATEDDISGAYRMMWESGCKGGTIYRDGCRAEQVLVSKDKSVYATGFRKTLREERTGTTYKLKVSGLKVYLTANTFDDGSLAEIFLRVSPHQGSTVDGLLDTFAKTFSVALQFGASLEDLIRLHKNTRFEPCGLTGNPDIPSCTSIPDYVVRWLENKFLGQTSSQLVQSGHFCPDCGSNLVYQSGCLTCLGVGCGWSRCG